MTSLNKRSLEVAKAALHGAWDANPDYPGVLYDSEAEMLTRAALTAYFEDTFDLLEALKLIERELSMYIGEKQRVAVPIAIAFESARSAIKKATGT
jgi:hypothetical protein